MKKGIGTAFLFLFFVIKMYSCDPVVYSFCKSTVDYAQENIFIAKVVEQYDRGLSLEVIEALRGEEPANIRVWDGTDINCNGPFPMRTSDYGEAGDTVIILVEKVFTKNNTWDVIGDYRRPSSINHTTYLRVKNGQIWNHTEAITYTEFVAQWPLENCLGEAPASEVKVPRIYPNPTSDRILIEAMEEENWLAYSLIAINGQIIQPFIAFQNRNEIDVEYLSAGIYVLQIMDRNGNVVTTRFVKVSLG